jgi:hypothetical protein
MRNDKTETAKARKGGAAGIQVEQVRGNNLKGGCES